MLETQFVKVYDDVFSPDLFKEIMTTYSNIQDLSEKGFVGSKDKKRVDNEVKCSWDFNLKSLNKYHYPNGEIPLIKHKNLSKQIEVVQQDLMLEYLSSFNTLLDETANSLYTNIKKNRHTFFTVQQFQLYLANEGHFNKFHADEYVGNTLYYRNQKSTRLFVFIHYLNDVEEGGETEFLYTDISVKPKKNRCVVFPATWPWVHKGKIPISSDKLILTTWLSWDDSLTISKLYNNYET